MTSTAKNSMYIMITKAAGLMLAVITSIFISRLLGPENRGIFYIVISVSTLLTVICGMGINLANTFFLSKDLASSGEVNGNSILSAFLIGIVPAIMFNFFKIHVIRLIPNVQLWQLYLVFITLPFCLYSFFWRGIMAGLNKLAVASVLEIVNITANTVIILLILAFSRDKVAHLLYFWALSNIIFSLIRHLIVHKYSGSKCSCNGGLFRKIFVYGFKGYLGNLAYYFFHSIDTLVVNIMVGAAGVGYYTLSVQLAEKTWLIPLSISEGSIPYIGREDKEKHEIINKVSRHGLMIAVISSLLLAVFGPFIVELLYGKEFYPAIAPFIILLPGTVFLYLAGVYSTYFSYKLGSPIIPSIVSWLNLSIYIPLAFVLIRRYGIIGAAVSSTICYFLIFCSLFYLYRHYTGASICDSLLFRREDMDDYFRFSKTMIRKTALLMGRDI